MADNLLRTELYDIQAVDGMVAGARQIPFDRLSAATLVRRK